MPNGTENINLNPQFVNQALGDYHLQANSPCIDAGTTVNTPNIDFYRATRP